MNERILARVRLLLAGAVLFLLIGSLSATPSLRVTTWRFDFTPATYTNIPPSRYGERQLRDAAGVLRSLDPDVILLTGVTNRQKCEQLAGFLKPANYQIAVCSRFRNTIEADDTRQVAILTRLPFQAASAEHWPTVGGRTARGGFVSAVIQQDTNVFACYVAQMPGDPGQGADPGPRTVAQREQSARVLVAHAERLQNQFTNQTVALVMAGDFHDDPGVTNGVTAAAWLESRGFRSVFQNVAMPRRFEEPPMTPDTWQLFDTVMARGADFLSVPQIGGTKLARHLPVTCTLARELSVSSEPDSMIKVDWARLGAAWSAPYRALPAGARTAVIWGGPILIIGALVFGVRRAGRKRRTNATSAGMAAPALAAPVAPQIEFPHRAGATVYVGESVSGATEPPPADSEAMLWQMRALEAEERARQAQAALRTTAMPMMFRVMRDKVLHMLGSQRAQLLDSHETGTRQVLQLEQRLEQIHAQFQENLRTRDRRIAELQEQLDERDRALRDATRGRERNSGRQVND